MSEMENKPESHWLAEQVAKWGGAVEMHKHSIRNAQQEVARQAKADELAGLLLEWVGGKVKGEIE